MSMMPLTFISTRLAILSCLPSLWCQQATLTGHIRDKKDNSPINGAQVVIEGSNRTATSNGDGEYLIGGLQRGQKVTAKYEADQYGASRVPVVLSLEKTVQDVQLYKDLLGAAYWEEVTKSLRASAPRARQSFFLKAWKDLDDSTLSPEVKVTAAQEFIKLTPEALKYPVDSEAAESLRDYGLTDWNRISDAKTEFLMVLTGSSTLRGKNRLVPDNVAVDIVAQLCGQVQISPGRASGFFVDFRDIYGARAADKLKRSMWRYSDFEWASGDPAFWIPKPPAPKLRPDEKK